jgi:folate-dependent phosphoribosylglycinamide formyltransferase PurN
VHLVDERYDEGRIIAQWPVPVLPGDTPETLAARVLRVEHLLLPAAVERMAVGADAAALADPIAFDLVPAPVPPADSLRRLSAPSDG